MPPARDRVDVVLFDLDGTLLDRLQTVTIHLEAQARRCAHLLGSVTADLYVERMLVLDQNGHAPRDEVYRRAELELGLPPGAAAALRQDFREHFPEQCVPFAGLHEMLETLRVRGIRLGLVTNGTVRTQGRKIERLGLPPLFDVILISEAEGCHKPDPRIFNSGLHRLGAQADSAMFVGDNPEADIFGASSCGLSTVWKRNDVWPEPPLANWVIDKLHEIPPLLK